MYRFKYSRENPNGFYFLSSSKNKIKQNKTKQNKTKQNKTKQNKTKQNKTKSKKRRKKTLPFHFFHQLY